MRALGTSSSIRWVACAGGASAKSRRICSRACRSCIAACSTARSPASSRSTACGTARSLPAGSPPSCMTASGTTSARPRRWRSPRRDSSAIAPSASAEGAMRPTVFTIASDVPFLDALAAGLLAQAGDDPLAPARQTVLLPTRRASRALREAFLRASGGKALLLPRLVPVGDVDAEELGFFGEDVDGEAGFDIPPAVPELRRQLLLTRLVLGWGRARGSGPLTAGQAAPLARELARFLDEVQSEGCDLARLASLVPANYAEHWQESLAFLAILTEHWPRLLGDRLPRSGGSAQPRAGGASRGMAPPAAAPPDHRRRDHRRRGGGRRSPRRRRRLAQWRRGAARDRSRDRRRELERDRRRSGASAACPGAAAAPARNRAGRSPPLAGAKLSGRPRRAAAPRCRGIAAGGREPSLARSRRPRPDGARRADAARLPGSAGRSGGHRAAAAPAPGASRRDRGAGHARPRARPARRRGAAALGHRDRRFRRRAAEQDAARHVPAPRARPGAREPGA